MSKYITLTNEQITNNPFVDIDGHALFYSLLRKVADVDENLHIDCSKVNVSENIQNSWYDYCEKHNMPSIGLSMLLVQSGPKALNLPDNTIEIQEGCFFKPENEDEE